MLVHISDLARRAAHGHGYARGQGLVEFALVFPVLFLCLLGVVDMGRFVYTANVLSQAAREAARLAAVEAGYIGSTDVGCGAITSARPGAHVCPADYNALKSDALQAAQDTYVRLGGSILGGTIKPSTFYMSCDAPDGQPKTRAAWIPPAVHNCDANTTGNVVSVFIDHTYSPLTPIIGNFITPALSGAATMVIN